MVVKLDAVHVPPTLRRLPRRGVEARERDGPPAKTVDGVVPPLAEYVVECPLEARGMRYLAERRIAEALLDVHMPPPPGRRVVPIHARLLPGFIPQNVEGVLRVLAWKRLTDDAVAVLNELLELFVR